MQGYRIQMGYHFEILLGWHLPFVYVKAQLGFRNLMGTFLRVEAAEWQQPQLNG